MNDESTGRARTLAVALLAVTLGVVLLASPAAAQEPACTEMLDNRTDENRSQSAPGGRLAAVIGDQRDSIGSALDDSPRNDPWLDDRLANATTARERARIVADEARRIEGNVSTLERCWGANRSASNSSEWSVGSERRANETAVELGPERRDALENLTRSLHRRVNETRAEAEPLPAPLRREHGVDTESLDGLERRVVALRNVTDRTETPPPTTGTAGQRVPIR